MRRCACFIPVLLLSLLFFSCGKKQKQNYEHTQANAAKRTALKIVSLGGQTTEIIFSLGKGKAIVGRDVTSIYPEQALAITSVGRGKAITAESILSTNANLLVMPEGQLKKETVDQLQAAKMDILTYPDKKSINQLKSAVKIISEKLDRKREGEAILSQIDRDLAGLHAAKDKRPKVLFVYARGSGAMSIAGNNTFAEEIIRLAGGQLAVEGIKDFKPLTPEGLIQANPDFMLFFDSGLKSLGGKEGVLKIQGVSETTAGKKMQIISMEGSLLSSFGPRLGQAVKELHEKISVHQ